MKKMKNNTLKKTTTKPTISFENNVSRSPRVQRRATRRTGTVPVEKSNTKATISFDDNFSRSPRVQRRATRRTGTVPVEKSNVKFSNQKGVCSSQKESKFLRQRHSGIPIDLTYIFPTVKSTLFPTVKSTLGNLKSMLGNLKEEELQSLDYKVLDKAEELIKKLHSISKANRLWWHQPLLNISIDDEIVFEWWHKEKKLTIYVCPNTIDFIKVWGANMDDEMEDGSIYLSKNSAILSLWQWIASSK